MILAGWTLVGLSSALLSFPIGFDGGPVVGLCIVGVVAYGLIASGADVRRGKKARETVAASEPVDPRSRPMRWMRASLRALVAVLLAAAAAFALATAWSLHGVGSAPDRVVVAAYALPLVWGAAIIWALSDERLRRPVLGLAALTALGALIVYWPGGAA